MDGVYDQEATDRSKALIVYFVLVSAGVAIFTDMRFGLWWLLILPVGIFLVSLIGGIWQTMYCLIFRRSPLDGLNSLPVILGHILIGSFGSYYALRAIHSWIN